MCWSTAVLPEERGGSIPLLSWPLPEVGRGSCTNWGTSCTLELHALIMRGWGAEVSAMSARASTGLTGMAMRGSSSIPLLMLKLLSLFTTSIDRSDRPTLFAASEVRLLPEPCTDCTDLGCGILEGGKLIERTMLSSRLASAMLAPGLLGAFKEREFARLRPGGVMLGLMSFD